MALKKRRLRKFNVFLGRRVIDGIFQVPRRGETLRECAEDIRRGLVNHDGYDPDISVRVAR